MTVWIKRALAGLTALTLCLAGTGCSFRIAASPDELYSLPQLPNEYTELDKRIQSILSDGAEYAAPTSGTNVQPVQLVDLNGDGQEEALAFIRNNADEKPLKIYVFSPRKDTYEQTAVIEGSGTAIYSITYSDLDGDGQMELLVGWKVGTELQALSVYSLRSGEPEELMSTNYVKYAVVRLSGSKERQVVVLRADDEGSGIADFYVCHGSALIRASAARLSMTMAELNSGRVTSGTLKDQTPALFVTGLSENAEAITDVLTAHGQELTNIVLSDTTGVSTEVYRYQSLFPTDINSDGITEVPQPVALPTKSGGNPGPNCRVSWLCYDSLGTASQAESTFHDTEDGWFLVLPGEWSGRIAVSRSQSGADEAVVTFSILGDEDTPAEDFLRIYTLTGNSRETKAVRGSRFILSRQTEKVCAAELLSANTGWIYGITEDKLCESFSFITTEWIAGDS